MPFAPGGKFCDRPGIGFACVWVANVGGEEFDEPLGCIGCRCEKGREVPGGWYGKLYCVFHVSLCKLSGVYLCIVFGAHATTPGS